MTIATTKKTSVWVWLPTEAHHQLVSVAAGEGVSLPVLARRAVACAVGAADGRVSMPAPTGEAVEELRAAGYELNRLLPALDGAVTRAQEGSIATRLEVALERVAAASDGVRLPPSRDAVKPVRHDDVDGVGRERWRLVRVTTDPAIATCWRTAAEAAGFRSTANWVRDALAGAHGLTMARPPAAVTIEARAVAGRVLGLLAQTITALAVRPHLGGVLSERVEAAETALWTGLQSLLAHGGQPRLADDERRSVVIAKITHGRSAVRALAYDHGPGRADEHVHPRKVGGNVPGRDWQQRAQRMQRFIAAHQHVQKDQGARGSGVYRVALANPESDRVLSDREWRSITEKFVTRFGADKGMWEATRHDRHHVHLTISKDRFDGTRMSTSHDFRRVAAICRELEREHGLTNAAERAGRGSGRVRADAEAAARGKPQPDRDWLRTTISRVLKEGGGIEELRAAGVQVRLNEASTGRVSGISYARSPYPDDRNRDRRSEDHESEDLLVMWFKGSALGKAYGWGRVGAQLSNPSVHTPPATRPAPSTAHDAPELDLAPEPLMLERSLELPSSTVAQRRALAYKDALDRAAARTRSQELHRRQDRER